MVRCSVPLEFNVVSRVMGNLFRDVVQSGRVGLELVSAEGFVLSFLTGKAVPVETE
jgi:hypothetical protein